LASAAPNSTAAHATTNVPAEAYCSNQSQPRARDPELFAVRGVIRNPRLLSLTINKPANQCGTRLGVMDGKDLEKRGRSGPPKPRAFRAEEPHDYADPFAAGCHRLRRPQNGKEGVDVSSPSEGFSREKIPVNRGFLLSRRAPQSTSVVRSGLLSDSWRFTKSACKSTCRAAQRSTSL